MPTKTLKKPKGKPTFTTLSKKTKKNQPIKLTKDNYYSHDTDFQYLSFSVFKDFEKCEAAALAKVKNDWQPTSDPTSLLVGNYVHSYFESQEAHEQFIDENKKEMISSRGKTKGQLKSDYKVADSCIEALSGDDFFKQVYGPGKKEVIVTGEINGRLWKGKIDSLVLDQGYFCDLKTVDDIHKKHWNEADHNWDNFIFTRQYEMQMAIYEELIRQTFDVECEPFIFAVSKQTPPDHEAFHFESDEAQFRMQEAMDHILQNQDRYWRILMGEEKPIGCGHCEYCRKVKKLSGFQDVSALEVY
ncbi:PD-(D/E)XK nuclease-like domain-containing protein [Limosilactobacillus coleohominis]|uniref:PD-(D/E)XK nuclease-like domain-containing protein n=1 Tax=Limosilactobacillus coleohominis TaxID=181675 RepID=UPI0026EF7AD1|nr:PD-(D/E)XK nuclease-like domain-containing protein [Limosilactobacillus coleohominis]